MRLANRGAVDLQRLPKQRLGHSKAPLRPHHPGEVVEVGRIVRMRLANRGAVDLQGLPIQHLGLGKAPLRLHHPGEVVEVARIVRMRLANRGAGDLQRLPIQRLGLGKAPQRPQVGGVFIQGGGEPFLGFIGACMSDKICAEAQGSLVAASASGKFAGLAQAMIVGIQARGSGIMAGGIVPADLLFGDQAAAIGGIGGAPDGFGLQSLHLGENGIGLGIVTAFDLGSGIGNAVGTDGPGRAGSILQQALQLSNHRAELDKTGFGIGEASLILGNLLQQEVDPVSR